jgi:hypothetical protein
VTSEKNGKKQTQTLGQQKKGQLKKARGSAKGRKKTKQKPTQVGQGLQLGFIEMDGLKTGKLGGALGGAGSLLRFFTLYLLSRTQKRHFIYFFLSFSKTFLNSHFMATTHERSNVRLKDEFART